MLKIVLFCEKRSTHNLKNLGAQATHRRSNYMAKVALGGTNNVPKAKKISVQCRTYANLQIRVVIQRAIMAGLIYLKLLAVFCCSACYLNTT